MRYREFSGDAVAALQHLNFIKYNNDLFQNLNNYRIAFPLPGD